MKSYLIFVALTLMLFSCSKDNSSDGSDSGAISALDCSAATASSPATSSTFYNGTITVPYTGGNGRAYDAGAAIGSTGVTGLTATLQSGTLASGVGNLTYDVSGTPSSEGTASFAISFGDQSCSVALAVYAADTVVVDVCSLETTRAAKVVCAANAFMASLSSSQLDTLVQEYSKTNVVKWSNLPCGSNCRLGIEFSTLTITQLILAQNVVQAATGTTANEGFDEAMQIKAAEDLLQLNGGDNYSQGFYFIAFLGTPTTTGTWQLQFGGHNLAINITYENGEVASGTPYFEGVEPKSWRTLRIHYAPLAEEQSTMAAMLASLSADQLATAKLPTTFSDVVLGPNKDGQFPTTKVGLQVSTLTDAQKILVLEAIKRWVNDVDDATAAALLATYQSELNSTYIAYSGNATLTNHADYVRIDGPNVWIEFVCLSGVVYQNEIHYRSIWRDHTRDYGGNYSF